MAAITPPTSKVVIAEPNIGKWIQKPVEVKINNTIVYSPGLFQTYSNGSSDMKETISSLNQQIEPWGAPHASLYKFSNPDEFNTIVNKALMPISICTYGKGYEELFDKCENNSVFTVNLPGYNHVLGVAARPQEGELFRERGWGIAPSVSNLNGIEFRFNHDYLTGNKMTYLDDVIEKDEFVSDILKI